jgi:hypothetical protein
LEKILDALLDFMGAMRLLSIMSFLKNLFLNRDKNESGDEVVKSKPTTKGLILLVSILSSLIVVSVFGLMVKMDNNNILSITVLILIIIGLIILIISTIGTFKFLGCFFGFLFQGLATLIFAIGIILVQLKIISFPSVAYILIAFILIAMAAIFLIKYFKK